MFSPICNVFYFKTNTNNQQNFLNSNMQWIPHQDVVSAPITSAAFSCNSMLVYASFPDGSIGILIHQFTYR